MFCVYVSVFWCPAATLFGAGKHIGNSHNTNIYEYNKNYSDFSWLQINSVCIFYNHIGHKIYRRHKSSNINHSQKSEFVNRKSLCKKCFGFREIDNYYSANKCWKSNQSYHTLLHADSSSYINSQNIIRKSEKVVAFQQNNNSTVK